MNFIKEKTNIQVDCYYKKILIIAFPIIIQGLVSSSFGMVDTLLIGSIGESGIAAVGIANQYLFNFTLIILAIGAGCSMFVARYYGSNDKDNILNITGIVIKASSLVSIIFALITWFYSIEIMKFFTIDEQLIIMGSSYLKIVSASLIPYSISTVFVSALRGIQETKYPMIASIVALILNTVLNFLLIEGHLGFPSLKVKGAALATLVSRIIEVFIILCVVYFNKKEVAIKFKHILEFNFSLFKKFIRSATHMILNDWLCGFAATIYMMAYAKFGKDILAAIQIAGTIQDVVFVVIGGLSTAIAIYIGKDIGENKSNIAYEHGQKSLKLSIVAGIIGGLILFCICPSLLNLFNISPTTSQIALKILWIYAFFMFIRFINFVFLSGILRGGGDTKWSMIVEIMTLWIIAVPIVFAGVFIFKLPIYIIILMTMVEEIIKAFLAARRFKSKKWIKEII